MRHSQGDSNVTEILKDTYGCDLVLSLPENRKNTRIKLLQLTDMQVIDSYQRCTPDRLREDEITAWSPDKFDANFGNQARSLITQTRPDMIFITGDMVYGSFDDKGTTFEWFCDFMDSFGIPWAPVFGNHDNESARGVDWQCERLAACKYSMFKRGEVTGNSNYTVGIAVGGELVRVMHMLDSNGCLMPYGIYPDQVELMRVNTEKITATAGREVPAFAAFHIAIPEYRCAELEKGYATEERSFYVIGVDIPSKDGDFGMKYESHSKKRGNMGEYLDAFKRCNIDGVFVGHQHNISTCISWEGIRWCYGLKTGQYDFHVPGSLGGTIITLEGDGFEVAHVPALVPMSPMPGGAGFFKDYFVEGSYKH